MYMCTHLNIRMHIHSSIDIRPPFRFNREYLKRVEERKEEEKERTDKYRDRAEERRKGLGDEYKDNEALLSAYKANAAAESGNVLDGESNDARKLEIEQSKFLGGDMEHTHLVKGLDYALLQKIRSEQAKRAVEPVADSGEGSSAASSTAEKSKAAATAAATFAAAAASVQEDTPLTFRTKIGRGVYNTLFNKQPAMRNELFQTGSQTIKGGEKKKRKHTLGDQVPLSCLSLRLRCAISLYVLTCVHNSNDYPPHAQLQAGWRTRWNWIGIVTGVEVTFRQQSQGARLNVSINRLSWSWRRCDGA